jgi:(E)-4-hydroxy-3-methylbut-2-enyl-diphosphate synthase
MGRGIELVSCPTCARTSVDLIGLCRRFETLTAGVKCTGRLKVAIMGCEVNGPGEASDADLGLAFSRTRAFLFKKGKIVARLAPQPALERLVDLVRQEAGEKKHG